MGQREPRPNILLATWKRSNMSKVRSVDSCATDKPAITELAARIERLSFSASVFPAIAPILELGAFAPLIFQLFVPSSSDLVVILIFV